MFETKSNPDTNYGYRAMTASLQLQGSVINPKKVHRLLSKDHLLHEKQSKSSRNYVRFRKVWPTGPLSVIKMDIKFQWVEGRQRYGFILTALDSFTRKALAHKVGYSIKKEQVKSLWDSIIVNYLQPSAQRLPSVASC